MRIPTRIHLPFGYVVRVRQVRKSELDGCYADWDSDTRTIRIQKSLPVSRKMYLCLHELSHAINDAMHAMLDSGQAKNTP